MLEDEPAGEAPDRRTGEPPDDPAVAPWLDPERNKAIIRARVELASARDDAWASPQGPTYVKLRPPDAWHHPVTGRRELGPGPELVRFGRYLSRARALVGLTQQTLADRAEVTQSMVSRAERGLAPAMGVDPLTRIGRALGRTLPLGFCPHEHACAWQPLVPREPSASIVELMFGSRRTEMTDDEAHDHTLLPRVDLSGD